MIRPDTSRAILKHTTANVVPRAPFHPFEQRRAELQQHEAMSVSNHRITGFLGVVGAGEVAVDVLFPLWFVEKPGMSFGGELAEGHSAEALNMPTCSVVVLRWNITTRGLAKYWVGATLAVVTTGKLNHQMTVHWHMEGKAFINPVAGSHDTSATI